ncbi:MAG: TIGR03943 family protein [Chthoniobacterales bacterium]|nr:TIGR03943 family protein [Chthoniobacterales bacterium]
MMKRVLATVALAVWSATLMWLWLAGRLADYLHPQFHTPVAVAAFVLMALVPLWWWASGESNGHACGCHHDHEEPAQRGEGFWSLAMFALLIVPVAASAFVSPGQFGEAAVRNRGIVSDVSLLPTAPALGDSLESAPEIGAGEELPDVADFGGEEGVEYFTRGDDGAIQLEIIDLLFAAEEPALRETFENEKVAVVGQYAPRPGKDAGAFDLVRMFVVCCAADARPLGVKVSGITQDGLESMGWVRVTGVARFAGQEGAVETSLELEKIEPVEAPDNKLLH